MRTCNTCSQGLDDSEFYSRKDNKIDYKCKGCHRAYRKEHYSKNKQYYLDKANKSMMVKRLKVKEIIEEAKASGCVDCGRTGPSYCFDFDHIDDNKLFNISNERNNVSYDKLKEEIAKCEVVCAWCHRIRTHNRNMPS
jgi:hypothetical protein